jgi:Gnt-I system high-affinity gluconate transporter
VAEPEAAGPLPGRLNSFLSSLLPVLVLAAALGLKALVPAGGPLAAALTFLADPGVVMLLSVVVATFSLGRSQGRSVPAVMSIFGAAVADVAPILLITAGRGR